MLEGWWSQWPFSAVIRKHNLWSPRSHWQISHLVRQDTGRGILQARLKVNIYTVYLMVSTQHFAYGGSARTQSQDTGCLQHRAQCPCRTKATPGNPLCLSTGIGQCCPSSSEGRAGHRKVLGLLPRRSSQLCPAVLSACPEPVSEHGLLTYHVDAKGNKGQFNCRYLLCSHLKLRDKIHAGQF